MSGGADSVALLMLLLELREKLGIVLSVVHLNHKLRAKASEADEKFVAGLAAKHGARVSRGECGRGGARSARKSESGGARGGALDMISSRDWSRKEKWIA